MVTQSVERTLVKFDNYMREKMQAWTHETNIRFNMENQNWENHINISSLPFSIPTKIGY